MISYSYTDEGEMVHCMVKAEKFSSQTTFDVSTLVENDFLHLNDCQYLIQGGAKVMQP